jgi:hypothetical protein
MVLVPAVVILAFFALVSTATANRLRSSSSTFRATYGSAEFSGGFGTSRCSLTLEGSLHSATITKTAGALIGYITRTSVGPCSAGSATINTSSLPWHVRYESFSGTLPNITGINSKISGAEFSIRETFGITCTASRTAEPITIIQIVEPGGGTITVIRLGGATSTSCGTSVAVTGNANSVVVPGSATKITVTLV